MRNVAKNKQQGMTLVELMVVIVVLGIVTSIAVPSYRQYMMRANRVDAKAALLEIAAAQEEFYLQNNTYTTVPANVGGTATEENYYVLSIDAADVNTFTLRATAAAGGPQANDTTTNHGDCTVLQLTAAGAKTPDACW